LAFSATFYEKSRGDSLRFLALWLSGCQSILGTTIMSHISRVEEVFLAAVAQPDPKLRATFLDAACDQDEDLRRQVETLLAAQPQLGQFLEPSIALGQSENAAATVSAGDRVTVTISTHRC
jgi:hypothetical protein